ncbi:hypothetical protein NG800_003660 [Epilithonimonas ginsengisoli]|uniref:Cytochrome c n=1 Tax=Epilithonimonas ginsengisoli TaxID=1245592 RepID=A0ABU4JE97_9FLAO|nr:MULTISPECIES: hypothetical protein [Chryseobacterium group]MBV6879309.1 hypothetical protein [Epilithonimonas sp. FP105]MDW8547994.1 hypothetical protein [Epilithonimonas ginsengisoli]OAH73086.1 hypothetical protein AXA65_08430 [Chryseobacterium sp. FP211-J200]
MKKYIYSLCLVGVIVYSCKTQQAAPATTQAETSVATANLSKEEMLKKGQELFTLKCGRCHGLPVPSEITVADWQPIMARMAPKAKLNADETNWVLAYVNENAKK